MTSTGTERVAGGTITKMVTQKKDADRVSVFLNGTFAFGVEEEVVVRHGLRVGRELTPDEVEQILSTEAETRARNLAMDYLARRPRTVHEVREKLKQKAFDEETIAHVLDRLLERGYLDDAAYAEEYVRVRTGARGYGPRRVMGELLRRGVTAELIERALDTADSDTLYETALKIGQKRWQLLRREPDPQKRRKKLSDFLLRRGYGFDVVRRVLAACQSMDK